MYMLSQYKYNMTTGKCPLHLILIIILIQDRDFFFALLAYEAEILSTGFSSWIHIFLARTHF